MEFNIPRLARRTGSRTWTTGPRIAPTGNRTGGVGELPHYHRRIVGPDGKTVPGGSMKWHRPWEP
jgi:hypothetical protein